MAKCNVSMSVDAAVRPAFRIDSTYIVAWTDRNEEVEYGHRRWDAGLFFVRRTAFPAARRVMQNPGVPNVNPGVGPSGSLV